MTRTSQALKRLGVAGLAAVTIGAGVPALIAAPAQAAGPVTSVTFVNPASGNKTGAAGTCINYTLVARDATATPVPGATITVRVTDTTTPVSATQDIDFCTTSQTGFTGGAGQPAPSGGTIVTNAGPSATGAGTDVARFLTDANGLVTFGVISREAGSASIQTFQDSNSNGTFDAGELAGQNGTATFGPGGPAGTNANQNAAQSMTVAPTSDAAVVGEPRPYKVTVYNSATQNSTTAQAGVVVTYTVSGAETQGPTNCPGSTDNNGVLTCTVTFTKVTPPNDTVTFYVNKNGVGSSAALDAGEPSATVTPVTVQAAPTAGAQSVTASCLAVAGPKAQTTTSPCVNEVNDPSRVVRFVVENTSSSNTTSTVGTLLGFAVTGGSGDETVSPAECSTTDYNAGSTPADPGTSTTNSFCDVTVNDPTPVSGEVLTVTGTIRGTSTKGSATVAFRNAPSDARNITLTPKTATTAPNTARTFTAAVIDSDGKPVQGVSVTFTESGAGAFRNGSSSVTTTTDANGQASTEVISLPGETGTETITATIDAGQTNSAGATVASQCSQAANAGQSPRSTDPAFSTTNTHSAGNCSDTATNTFSSASPSPSTSPSAGGRPTLATSTPDIQPNQRGLYQATNLTAGVTYELRCYSRPSTTYFTARSITASTSTLEYGILPGTNTRCYVRPAGDETKASNSVVINVHTTLSLSAVRTGVRTYVFQGRNLPRRSGQLITLYRLSGGQEIRTSNLVTDASGIFRVTRTFSGTGTFQFRVRTSQNLTNAAGASVAITVTVH